MTTDTVSLFFEMARHIVKDRLWIETDEMVDRVTRELVRKHSASGVFRRAIHRGYYSIGNDEVDEVYADLTGRFIEELME